MLLFVAESYKFKSMSKNNDLYISYSRSDYDGARMIVDVLQKQGYSCFVDFNNLGSGTFDEQIFEAINSSKCFVLLYYQERERMHRFLTFVISLEEMLLHPFNRPPSNIFLFH